MESIAKTMNNILEKIDIEFEGQIISKELIIKTFGDFLCQTVEKNKHNVGLVMHTGSICFDVIAVAYAALFCILSSNSEIDDIVDSLREGDMVLLATESKDHQISKQRCVFIGMERGDKLGNSGIRGMQYIKLSQGSGKVFYLPQPAWKNIEPYNGNATTLGGSGIKAHDSIRDDFFVEVLGYEKNNVPSVIDVSSVIVSSKERIDYLIKGISFIFNGKTINLLELVTASYYTEEEELRYSGNEGRNEPILKFSSKISVARTLVLSRAGNRHIGVTVLGDDAISRGYSELPELMNRQSLQYVYLCAHIDNDDAISLFKEREDAEVFACTKDFLLEHSTPDVLENNDLVSELGCQVSNIIDKNNDAEIIFNHAVTREEHRNFRNMLLTIKRAEYSSEDKDSFVITSWSLMKLFDTAIFPIKAFDDECRYHAIEAESSSDRLRKLEVLSQEFPARLKKIAGEIIEILKTASSKLAERTGKHLYIKECLKTHQNERVAIVVPKAYYAIVLRNASILSEFYLRKTDIVTPTRFDKNKLYDFIIVVGNIEGKRFNAFHCNSASSITTLLYECEEDVYFFKEKSAKNTIHYLQSHSSIEIEDADDVEPIEDEEKMADAEENEIYDYVSQVNFSVIPSYYVGTGDYSGNTNSEIVSIAFFDDETFAYFSKRYKGYILDESTGVAREVESQNICEGDLIVFTANNNDTKDIVSAVLSKMLIENRLSKKVEEDYRKANLWKTALIDYMRVHGLTERDIAYRMIRKGAPVEEAAIFRWLDEDSHTVGPRKLESIKVIGKLTGVAELVDDAEGIFEACRNIRSIRRKILSQVGMAIVERISGRKPKSGSEFEDIYERIDSLATIKRVEKIKIVDNMIVPMNVANKPLSM